jgi:dipeptidyl aminopeptidase/acylaminoacyl peptidase
MESYLRIENALGPDFHPTNPTRLSFVYNGPSLFQVFSSEVSTPLSWPTQLTYSSQRCTDCSYTPSGELLFHTDINGNENWQIGSVTESAHQRRITHLTDKPTSKHTIQHITSKFLYFTANWTSRSVFDLYRIPIGGGLPAINESTATLVYDNKEPGVILSVQTVLTVEDEDTHLVLRLVYGNDNHHLTEISLGGEKPVYQITRPLLASPTDQHRWYATRYIDRNSLLVTTDYKRDLLHFSVLQLDPERTAEAKFVDCDLSQLEAASKWEVDETYATSSYPSTIFTMNEAGYSSVYVADFMATGELANLRNLTSRLPERGVVSSGDTRTSRSVLSLSSDHKLLAFNFSSPRYPSNVYMLALDDQEPAKPVTAVQTGGLVSPNAFSEASLSSFQASDGLEIPYLRIPPPSFLEAQGKRPCIIRVHGGPESQTRPAFSYLTQFLAANGYLLIEPNIRGSTGYGRFYLDADNVEKRLDSIRDLAELVEHLKKTDPLINPDLVFVFGGSYGGFAVLSAITEYPDLWAGGVDLFGISNFETFLENTAAWRRKLREAEYGSLEHDRDVLRRISPIHQVDKITAPLFLFQGDADERVPLSETLQMYERMVGLGKKVTFVRVANEGHGITIRENVLSVYGRVLQFLNELVDGQKI